MLKAIAVRRASEGGAQGKTALASAILAHDERHLRRRAIELTDGARVLVDLPGAIALEDGDALLTEDDRAIAIIAADEPLYDIRAQDQLHLARLAWHLGNRHLAAAIEPDRILILRDHVIKAMLEGLGAEVSETLARFQPVRGAYSGHGNGHRGHSHEHGYTHGQEHTHEHTHEHAHHHQHD